MGHLIPAGTGFHSTRAIGLAEPVEAEIAGQPGAEETTDALVEGLT